MKGSVFEGVVQETLEMHGYEPLDDSDPKINSSSGYLQGRGTKHEMDAFGEFPDNIPFVHPVRLIVEAKCKDNAVSVGNLREAIIVRKDIQESYRGEDSESEIDRRTEMVAVFSTSGFSKKARNLAYAHNIFLVYMGHLRGLVNNIVESLEGNSKNRAYQKARQHIQEHMERSLLYGTLDCSYPVTLFGDSIPQDRVANSDDIYVNASSAEDGEPGAERVRLKLRESDNIHSESGWSAEVGIPTKIIDSPLYESYSITIPTEIGEVRRLITVNVNKS